MQLVAVTALFLFCGLENVVQILNLACIIAICKFLWRFLGLVAILHHANRNPEKIRGLLSLRCNLPQHCGFVNPLHFIGVSVGAMLGGLYLLCVCMCC